MKEFSVTISGLKEDATISLIDTNEFSSGSSLRLTGYGTIYPPFQVPRNNETNPVQKYGDGIHVGKVHINKTSDDASYVLLFSYLGSTDQSLDKFQHVDITIGVSSEVFFRIKSESLPQNNSIQAAFTYPNEIASEDAVDRPLKCTLESLKIVSSPADQNFIKRKTRELEFYLNQKHCATTSSSQASLICKEFSESLAKLSDQDETDNHLEKVDEFLINLRSTLRHAQGEKIAAIKKELGIETKGYLTGDDIEAIKDRIAVDRDAVRQFDLIWKKESSSKIFSDGLPFTEDDARNLTCEYLQLGVRSKFCEGLLIGILSTLPMAALASSAQFTGEISTEALLTLPYPIYDKSKIDNKKSFKEMFGKLIGKAVIGIISTLITGYFSWWVTGLVADTNQTARLILFGMTFLASWYSSGYAIQKTLLKDEEKEKHQYESLVLMCNLYEQSDVADVGLIRAMLYNIETKGIKFPREMYQLLSLDERGQPKCVGEN